MLFRFSSFRTNRFAIFSLSFKVGVALFFVTKHGIPDWLHHLPGDHGLALQVPLGAVGLFVVQDANLGGKALVSLLATANVGEGSAGSLGGDFLS